MKKTTAVAPSNIAFIKYWGKTDDALRLPTNSSISMNLSGAFTTTTVEFLPGLAKDDITIVEETFTESENQKISKHLDRIRTKGGVSQFAKVVTQNSFPKGTGIASSASGFAALTVAASGALGLSLKEKELTILARLGSGSACRSIPDGFVLWEKGSNSENSYAHSLYPHDYWDLLDILVVIDSRMKKISTSDGMSAAGTSQFFPDRLAAVEQRLEGMRRAFAEKNFSTLGSLIEEDCLNMHAVMQSQVPPLIYWNETTKSIMGKVRSWRSKGLSVYFTIDAGPNVHLICEGKDEEQVLEKVKMISGIESVIVNKSGVGARTSIHHLF